MTIEMGKRKIESPVIVCNLNDSGWQMPSTLSRCVLLSLLVAVPLSAVLFREGFPSGPSLGSVAKHFIPGQRNFPGKQFSSASPRTLMPPGKRDYFSIAFLAKWATREESSAMRIFPGLSSIEIKVLQE